MFRAGRLRSNHSWIGRLISGFVTAFILIGATGPSCDSDAAATFRQTATSAVGEGVRTIVNGVLDGLIGAVENAGDGGSTSTDASSTN